MLQMEIYKLLKRKLVWGILVVLFLFAIFINITDFNRDIGRMQYELEKYEAAKGILTDARLQDFHRNYHPAEFDEFENSFMENGTLKKVSELYPDADFKLHFGYYCCCYFCLHAFSSSVFCGKKNFLHPALSVIGKCHGECNDYKCNYILHKFIRS